MRKTAVVYWSGTGNTQMMAEKVAEGVRAAGAEADVYNCTEFSADLMDNYEAVAFGCPSMGSEQLEDTEFEPVFTECEAKLSGKVIGLFGSYGWGDGCATGKSPALVTARSSQARASSATKHRTTKQTQRALRLARSSQANNLPANFRV